MVHSCKFLFSTDKWLDVEGLNIEVGGLTSERGGELSHLRPLHFNNCRL